MLCYSKVIHRLRSHLHNYVHVITHQLHVIHVHVRTCNLICTIVAESMLTIKAIGHLNIHEYSDREYKYMYTGMTH